MSSSLATQLAQNASLNTHLLSTSRRKPPESYLFPASQAVTHDLESIHFLASSAFLQLKSVQPSCAKYEFFLFSDAVKDIDRTLLSKEKNEELDGHLKGFLTLLGPWLMEGMTGKILEWLVRRFRINEFNVEDVLVLFLPYHESPHFAKMLSILHIKPQSRFSFLLPFKSAAKHLPRSSLVSSMIQDTDLARFVCSLLPTAHQEGYSYRALLAFNIGVVHEYIVKCKIIDESIIAFVISALVETLKGGSDGNVVLGSYVLLSTLSHKCRLAPQATNAIIGSMVESAPRVLTGQFMKAAVAVCVAQDQVDDFGDGVVRKFLKLSNIGEEICNAFAWAGSEKFVCPLLSGFTARLPKEVARTILESILTSNNIPSAIITRLTELLINAVVSSEDGVDTTPQRALLSMIQQRYPSILQKEANKIMFEEEDTKEAVEQLIISLAMTFSKEPRNKANADMVIASTNANQNVRVIAVNSLLKILSDENIEAPDLASIHSALLARAHDTNAPVVQALYSHPSSLLPVLTASHETYIAAVTQILSKQPSRALIRAHLSFLASHFCVANPNLTSEIFDKCFFRFLLFSKSRKETAKATWEIIEGAKDGVGAYELIHGCAEDWRWHTDRLGGETVDVFASANMAIAARMAENIIASSEYPQHLTSLLEKMQDTDSHTRIMIHLVARALLGRLSGEQQIDAANSILNAMHIETLDGIEDISEEDNDGNILLDDRGLGLKIVQKPTGRKTTYWLKTSIFALLPLIARPTGIMLDWFADTPSDATNTRGFRYVSLMRAVYKLANSSASLPLLTTNIIRTIFLRLQDDTLVFLIGIVVRCHQITEDKGMCIAALRHAASFLAAQRSFDFQTILPALIVIILDADADIRTAAMDCLAVWTSKHEPFHAVYGFDTIYGDKSSNLLYLDAMDVLKYIKSIIGSKDLIIQDGNYLKIFHQQHLKSDLKTDVRYKQRILSYFLSHVVAITLPSAKIALLRTIESISDEVKAQVLLPVMQDFVQHSQLVDQLGIYLEEFATLVVSSFDRSSSGALNEESSTSWPIFVSALRHFFQSASLHAPRSALRYNLEHGLFAALSPDRQIEICMILLEIGVHDHNALFCKKILGNIVRGAPLIQHLLTRLQPTITQVASPAKKRARLDESASSRPTTDLFPLLALLAEILAANSLPGSLDLISRLLDTLNNVLHRESPTQGDKSFVEQLLMTAVENAAEKVVDIPNLSPSSIRLDILVELIRVSDNTQTFHQALLLMANLARLTPESVLHNIMPVFTFMGSNVFHRDDSYSFRVVQQTVDSIVPVMVSSLKTKFSGQMDLYIGSRDFLRIFTDAANHVPRHRRTNFFSHLVDVLGPEDFLAPICMLLIDKVANRVIRQNADEVQGSVALPISILRHYSNHVQISTLTELLRESQRLVNRVTIPGAATLTFMDFPRGEEHSLPLSSIFKRRAQALITFVGHALQASAATRHPSDTIADEAVSELFSLLVRMATLQGGSTLENNVESISNTAQSTMSLSLSAMPAVDFIGAVLTTLQSREEIIQGGALDVLSSRLHNVTDSVRRTVTPIINQIVDFIRGIMSSTSNEHLMSSALKALRTISLTVCAGEESSLANGIPSVLAAIHGRKATATAMTTLQSLVTALGPRIIPNFREIINNCVSVLIECFEMKMEESTIMENALSVLQGMLISIPTFWGSAELAQVIRLHTDHYSSTKNHPAALMSLMKTMAKRAPAKVLLPTLCDMWSSIEASLRLNQDRIIAYFDLLKKSFRTASRAVVLENLRPLFKVFVEAFDIPSKLPKGVDDQVEAHSIPAFMELVVKLNEAAFQPIFRKLYDWAFTNDSETRKKSFCHIYSSLLDFFKGLMSPYMSFLLQPFTELLRSITISSNDEILWLCIVETLTKSLNYDEGAFWRSDRLRQIAPLLVEQVPVCIRFGTTEGKAALSACLDALTETVNDDALLKSINLELLMHTRSEDVRLRAFALTCSTALWHAHGRKLLGFVAETTTFMAECAEDDSDLVVQESHKLKSAVESVAGNINGL